MSSESLSLVVLIIMGDILECNLVSVNHPDVEMALPFVDTLGISFLL